MQELLEYLARALVDDPDAVKVEHFDEDDGSVVLELAVGENDYGKVIGRGGRIARAMRTALMISGSRYNLRVSLDIED